MRKTFTSREIAHIWINNSNREREGKCPSSMSFNGDAFYSYATVIARVIRHKTESAVVIDCAGFSVTTSGHQSCVRQAIPDSRQTFLVHIGEWGQRLEFTPAQLRDYYYKQFRTVRVKEKSRFAHSRAQAYVNRVDDLDNAIRVCNHFGLSAVKLEKIRLSVSAKHLECVGILSAHDDLLQQRRKNKDQKRRQQRVAQAIHRAEQIINGTSELIGSELHWVFGTDYELLESRPELKEQIQKAVIRQQQAKIDAWLAGERNVFPGSGWPTMLRLETNGEQMADVVTTKGARVPVADAERTYRFVMIQRARGWHKNGEKHAVYHYQLEAVNEQGIVIGCHRISWTEIERFAAVMGWSK